ncbi:hypothetical protein QQ045_006621 [Rhodiola kirilowii]
MTLRTLLPIQCTPIHVPGIERPPVVIQVINIIQHRPSMTVTCFNGDVNGPMNLDHLELYMFSCPHATSCICKLTSPAWEEDKEFFAFKYGRDEPFCTENKCRWFVISIGVALVDSSGPVTPVMKPLRFYNWADAM